MIPAPQFPDWSPSDPRRVAPVLTKLLLDVAENDPERFEEILEACRRPEFVGMEARPLDDGTVMVLAGDVPVGRFHIAALAREDLNPN